MPYPKPKQRSIIQQVQSEPARRDNMEGEEMRVEREDGGWRTYFLHRSQTQRFSSLGSLRRIELCGEG